MNPSHTLPDLAFVLESPSALYAVENEGLQTTCISCHRRSPLLDSSARAALARLVELGWIAVRGGTWRCPVCKDRESCRYNLRAAVAR